MNDFFNGVASIVERARAYAGRTADWAMCAAYFEIGRMIVEREQGGNARAEYGRGLIAELAEYLTGRFGKGFSKSNLRNCRQFYIMYEPSIHQTVSGESEGRTPQKSQTLSDEFTTSIMLTDNRMMSGVTYPFKLSWSHYQILLRIKNAQERRFYENDRRSVP